MKDTIQSLKVNLDTFIKTKPQVWGVLNGQFGKTNDENRGNGFIS